MPRAADEPALDHGVRVRARLRAAALSFAVAIVLFAAKIYAWSLTGSAAILSDALESVVNIVAAAMAWFSVWFAARPADENHPYGHGKIEDFSAGAEGAMIVLAALGIMVTAIPKFLDPTPLESLDRGAILVVGAAIVNLLLGRHLVAEGRRQHSRALEADGRHVLSDVVTSAGAIGALAVVAATGWLWVDPLVACLIALQILVSGFRLVRESVGRLMDEADEASLERVASRLQERRRPHWIDVHELRAWWAGDVMHVDLHLALPRYWSIEHSYAEATAIEREVARAAGKRSSVVVHVDPCRPRLCVACAVQDCPVRDSACEGTPKWTRDRLVRTVPPEKPAREVVPTDGRTRDDRS